MRLYNITPKMQMFSFGEMSCLTLGENGRGRKQVFVPVPENVDGSDQYEIAETRSGGVKIVKSNTSSPGWIARLSSEGTYQRGTAGVVLIKDEDADRVKIIASGHGAYGDAGRIGSWMDVVLSINADTPVAVKVNRSGRSENYYLVFHATRVDKVFPHEKTIYEERNDLIIPFKEGSN